MGNAKLFLGTFLTGGTVGCIGQALTSVYAAAGLDQLLATMAVLLTLGLAGAALSAAGATDKAELTGSVVVFFPFHGLGSAMARAHFEAREKGASFAKGVRHTFKCFLAATGPGIAVALIVGFIAGLVA